MKNPAGGSRVVQFDEDYSGNDGCDEQHQSDSTQGSGEALSYPESSQCKQGKQNRQDKTAKVMGENAGDVEHVGRGNDPQVGTVHEVHCSKHNEKGSVPALVFQLSNTPVQCP